jgi:hypothetical protein
MIRVIPSSPSLILSASHILLIRIERSQAGEWSPAPEGGVQRAVDLDLTLEETLKGETREKPGQQLQVTVRQYGTGTSRIAAVPGVWSYQPIDAGTRLVAFCRSDEDVAAEMLRDPRCEALAGAESALPGVRLALRAEEEDYPLSALLEQAAPLAASLDAIFVQYLWARYQASDEQDKHALTADLIEQPDLAYVARAALLGELYSAAVADPAYPPKWRRRLVVALFRLLGMEAAAVLHDQVVDLFLPNLLGLADGPTPEPAEVFREYPGEAASAEAALQGYAGAASAEPLLEWLRG